MRHGTRSAPTGRAADQTVRLDVDGQAIDATATRILDSATRQRPRLVLRWYWVGGRLVGSSRGPGSRT